MTDVVQFCIAMINACLPYAVAFWVVKKVVGIFLGAAFTGRMKL